MKTEIMTNETYHSKKDYVSSTMLKTLYTKSDMHLNTFKGNASTDFGTLAHTYILEPTEFTKKYSVMPEFTPIDKKMIEKYVITSVNGEAKEVDENYRRTKEYKEQKEAWEATHPNTVTESDIEKLQEMQTNIEASDMYEQYLTGGEAEVSVFVDEFKVEAPEGKIITVKAKVRFDYVKEIDGVVYILDLKTCQEASPWSFKSDIYRRAYDIQGAFYLDVATQFYQKEVKFIFLASESDVPYACGWYMMSKDTYEKGKAKYSSVMERAVGVLKGDKKRGYESSYKMVEI